MKGHLSIRRRGEDLDPEIVVVVRVDKAEIPSTSGTKSFS